MSVQLQPNTAAARMILDEVLGLRRDFVEHQLVYSVRDQLGRAYKRAAQLAERRKMMQRWADHLGELKAETTINHPPSLMLLVRLLINSIL